MRMEELVKNILKFTISEKLQRCGCIYNWTEFLFRLPYPLCFVPDCVLVCFRIGALRSLKLWECKWKSKSSFMSSLRYEFVQHIGFILKMAYNMSIYYIPKLYVGDATFTNWYIDPHFLLWAGLIATNIEKSWNVYKYVLKQSCIIVTSWQFTERSFFNYHSICGW